MTMVAFKALLLDPEESQIREWCQGAEDYFSSSPVPSMKQYERMSDVHFAREERLDAERLRRFLYIFGDAPCPMAAALIELHEPAEVVLRDLLCLRGGLAVALRLFEERAAAVILCTGGQDSEALTSTQALRLSHLIIKLSLWYARVSSLVIPEKLAALVGEMQLRVAKAFW